MPGPVQFTADMLARAMLGGEELAETPAVEPPRKQRPSNKPVAPKDIVKLAKARLRDVRAELRRMKALDREKLELERLIQAAEDTKPRLKKVAG